MKIASFLLFGYLLLEIAGFVVVGRAVGLIGVFLLLGLGLFAGLALVRNSGTGLTAFNPNQKPIAISGAIFRMLAGFLLIIPGFFSDILALLLLVPMIQKTISGRFRGQFDFAWAGGSFRQTTSGPVIDGEAVEIEEPIEKLPPRM